MAARLTDLQKQWYHRSRDAGVPAVAAIHAARCQDSVPHYWRTLVDCDEERREVHGFDVVVTLKPDYNYDSTELGYYTDVQQPGAIKRRHASRGEYRYFVPEVENDKRYVIKWARRTKAKHAAWLVYERQRRWQYQTAEDLNCGAMSAYDIFVKVYKAGVELAHTCFGAGIIDDIHSADALHYVSDLADDAVAEAVSDAADKLKELKLCD